MGIEKQLLDRCFELATARVTSLPPGFFGFENYSKQKLSYNQNLLAKACGVVIYLRGWSVKNNKLISDVRDQLTAEICGIDKFGVRSGLCGHETNSSTYDALSCLGMAAMYHWAAKVNDELTPLVHRWWELKIASWETIRAADRRVIGPGARSKKLYDPSRDKMLSICKFFQNVPLKEPSVDRRHDYMCHIARESVLDNIWTASYSTTNVKHVKLVWPISVERYPDGSHAAWFEFSRSWDTPIQAVFFNSHEIEEAHPPIVQGRFYPERWADPPEKLGTIPSGPGVGGDTVCERTSDGLTVTFRGRTQKLAPPIEFKSNLILPNGPKTAFVVGS